MKVNILSRDDWNKDGLSWDASKIILSVFSLIICSKRWGLLDCTVKYNHNVVYSTPSFHMQR
jgi:hypothetical protein